MKTEILILISGGVVQDVYSNLRKEEVDLLILDMDDLRDSPEYKEREESFKALLSKVHSVY